MKAIDVLRCIMYMDLCGEDFIETDVPSKDDELTPQDEEWWMRSVGGVPDSEVEEGKYLYFFPNDARDFLQTDKGMFVPDATIHVDDNIVYLYKLEDCSDEQFDENEYNQKKLKQWMEE